MSDHINKFVGMLVDDDAKAAAEEVRKAAAAATAAAHAAEVDQTFNRVKGLYEREFVKIRDAMQAKGKNSALQTDRMSQQAAVDPDRGISWSGEGLVSLSFDTKKGRYTITLLRVNKHSTNLTANPVPLAVLSWGNASAKWTVRDARNLPSKLIEDESLVETNVKNALDAIQGDLAQ